MSCKHVAALILAGLVVAGCQAGHDEIPAEIAPPAETGLAAACRTVEAYAQRLLEEENAPGLAVALTSRDGWQWVGAWGMADLKLGRPTAYHLFEIGSISKTFTALALLQLAEEGRFDPQAPVTDYLPWFRVQSDHPPITGHHLPTHSSGLPANRDDIPGSWYMAYAVRERSTGTPPGERFAYSNVGYQILSVLLETLERRPIREVIGERILGPLAMSASRASFTTALRDRLAVGYQRLYDDRPYHHSHPLVEATWLEYEVGDGNAIATPGDLAAFLRMLLNRGQGPAGRIRLRGVLRSLPRAARHRRRRDLGRRPLRLQHRGARRRLRPPQDRPWRRHGGLRQLAGRRPHQRGRGGGVHQLDEPGFRAAGGLRPGGAERRRGRRADPPSTTAGGRPDAGGQRCRLCRRLPQPGGRPGAGADRRRRGAVPRESLLARPSGAARAFRAQGRFRRPPPRDRRPRPSST